jgi:ubiquinone/menaquinone biosynthesis C-methylase UbiE
MEAMGWLMAKLYDHVLRPTEEACLRAWRRKVLARASGEVLEIGAGTGANLPGYPATVRHVVLAEPDRHMRAVLEQNAAGEPRAEISDAPAESLPFASGRFDFVVGTFVLCSVSDVSASLAEIRRVLRPGGALLFIEHVAAEPRTSRRRWQGWIEPLWSRFACNCHLTRQTAAALAEAGFRLDPLVRESMRKAAPLVRLTIRGAAWKTG